MGGNKRVYRMCIGRPTSSNVDVDLTRSRIEMNDPGGSKAMLPPFFLPLILSFISGALLPTCTSSIYTSHTELPHDPPPPIFTVYLLEREDDLWQVWI